MTEALTRLGRILEEVGRIDGVQGLRLDDDGAGGLELEDGTTILFEYVRDGDRFFVYTPLMTLPRDDPQRSLLLEALLSCNFLELCSGKGCVAVSEHTAQAVYQIGLDAESVTVQQLDRTIDALLQCRREILRALEQGAARRSDTARQSAASRPPARRPSTITGPSSLQTLMRNQSW